MAWADLAYNQTISFNNLQDAVNNGIFTAIAAIPASDFQITKADASSEIVITNPNYPGFANKSAQFLLVKSDIYNLGNVSLSAQYGMYFTSITATGFPSFSYPVTGAASGSYKNIINGQNITVYLNGTRYTTPLSITLYVGGAKISCKDITSNGAQSKSFTLPTVYAPTTVYIAIDSGACSVTPPPPTFGNKPYSAVAISKTTGQYQVIAGGYIRYTPYIQGYLYKSSDYGASFLQLGTIIGYWSRIAINNSGNNILVCELSGALYYSSDGGSIFTNVGLNIYNSSYPTSGNIYWNAIAMSDDGTKLIASYQVYDANQERYGYFIYLSSNSGVSWTDITSTITNQTIYTTSIVGFTSAGMSANGQYMYVTTNAPTAFGANGPIIYKSSNYGSSWSQGTYHGTLVQTIFRDISVSEDGSTYVATGVMAQIPSAYLTEGYICKSTDYGANIYEITNGQALNGWYRIGMYKYTAPYANPPYTYGFLAIYLGIESSTTTIPKSSYLLNGDSLGDVVDGSTNGMGSQKFTSIAIGGTNNNGAYVLITADNGVWRSYNGGGSWTKL
jgi:hypothetical protein